MYKQQDNNEKAKLLIETFNKKTESLMNRSKLNPRYFCNNQRAQENNKSIFSVYYDTKYGHKQSVKKGTNFFNFFPIHKFNSFFKLIIFKIKIL